MAKVDNSGFVLYRYLRILSVKVSRGTVHRLLDSPLGDSMRGVSDAMNALHIKNEVYQLPSSDYFSQLKAPFITTLEVDSNPFCLVVEKDDFIVTFFNDEGQKRQVEVDKFLQHWTGSVLIGEATEKTPEEPLYALKNTIFYLLRYKLVIVILCILTLGLHSASYQTQVPAFIIYLSTLSLGILVSAAILYKERINEQFMERFCHIGEVVNCNEVLHSKGATVAGAGLGELSLFYFSVLYLFSLIRWGDFYGISVICCVVAIAFTLYSIIYQVFVLRKGCLLCMIVNLAIWGNAVALYMLKSHFVMELSLPSILVFIAISCIGYLLFMQLRSLQDSEKERIKIKGYLGNLFDPETFEMLLAHKPQIGEIINQNIAMHNHKSNKNELMIVTNPNCNNCAKSHRHIMQMASAIPISLVLVTSTNDRLGERIAQIIIAAYIIDGWNKAMELLGEWYETRDIKEVEKYKITAQVKDVWMKQQAYCRKQRINKTPSVIVTRLYRAGYFSPFEAFKLKRRIG